MRVCWCKPTRCMRTALFPLPRPAQRRLPDRGQTWPPQRVSVDSRWAHLRPADPLAHQQAGNQTGPRHHLGLAGDAGTGVGGGAVAGQRDDHRRAQPWHPRWQANRRDSLLRLEFAHWCQGHAQGHPSALVNREQLALGAGCAAEGRRSPLPGEQRRPNPGHPPQPGHQCPAARWHLVDH